MHAGIIAKKPIKQRLTACADDALHNQSSLRKFSINLKLNYANVNPPKPSDQLHFSA
jgi:hypothetical protein